jgi:exodeoxyribonuclease VII large subunit
LNADPEIPAREESVPSVAQLTARIKSTLEGRFRGIWVKGEISNFKQQSSGHLYFTLKDAQAQIQAVMFRGDAARLSTRLADGQSVTVCGDLSVYEPRGNYQIIVRECIASGVGRLQAEFERLKRTLQLEGLFDPANKKAIPALPRKVAVITSPTGAAFRDFISILKRRNWTGEVLLFPSLVQGADGAKDLIQKLQWAQNFAGIDLIVIGRGGGSLEDLWNFNEEALVRAVAACPLPILSAVGHEIDIVLTDFAADKRAETPSAAAELISSGYVDATHRLQRAALNLKRIASDALLNRSQLLKRFALHLKALTPSRFLEHRHQRVDELQERLRSCFQHRKQDESRRLESLLSRIKSASPLRLTLRGHENLDHLKHRLNRSVGNRFDALRTRLESSDKQLQSLGVEQVLRRGYALVTRPDGSVVTQGSSLKDQDWLQLRFHDQKCPVQVKRSKQLELFDP